MAKADVGGGGDRREIRLIENPDGQWTARDVRVEVTAQGATRTEALEALDAVVEAVAGDGGHEPTDDEIRNLGVDPDVARKQDEECPRVLR
ncbi:MAG: type II toxin-antitoxin system HicB family antitoxin [Halobaculum sp.]